MQDDPIVIVGTARTPMGGLMGELSTLPATELGSISIAAALERADVPAEDVNEVLMGNVLPAGPGPAPAPPAAGNTGPGRRPSWPRPAAATAGATAASSTTCSTTAWRTPTRKAN
ncbi:MAG: hypothetical protein LAT50_20485 [Ectothiorhodospiraceae bacterium]|nr:hypothetical protein [Ectothiorhodospiraceae bacterium]